MKNFTHKTILIYMLTLLSYFSFSSIKAQEKISLDDLKGAWEILANESEFSFNITTIWVFPQVPWVV